MDCSTCTVSRRQFVTSATLASVAAVLAACGGGDAGPVGPGGSGGSGGTTTPPPPITGTVTVRIADHPDLAVNLRPVAVTASIAVVRNGSAYLAFSRACTHEGVTVQVTGATFTCPSHGSRFDATGQVLNGPATQALNRLSVVHDTTAGTLAITA